MTLTLNSTTLILIQLCASTKIKQHIKFGLILINRTEDVTVRRVAINTRTHKHEPTLELFCISCRITKCFRVFFLEWLGILNFHKNQRVFALINGSGTRNAVLHMLHVQNEVVTISKKLSAVSLSVLLWKIVTQNHKVGIILSAKIMIIQNPDVFNDAKYT